MTNKNFICRDYRTEDYKQLELLWKRTDVGNPARGDNPRSIEQTLKLGGKLILLEHTESGRIAGSSWLTVDGRRMYLHHFAILPEFQGQKLSHLLLKASFVYAKEIGLQIKLEVHQDNLKALNLYKNAGFKYLGDYQVFIIRDLDTI